MAKHLPIEKYVPAVRLQGGIYTNLPVTLNGTAANLTVGGNLTVTGTTNITSDVITSNGANAFTVGPNGTTNPTFNVDASTASAATGLNIKSAAAASGVALSVLSSGTDENLTIDAKGAGTVTIAGTSTGGVSLNDPTTINAAAALTLAQVAATTGTGPTALTVTGAAHTGLTVGEVVDVNLNLSRTVTFTTGGGTITTQRAVLIQPPTYAAGSATTITTAATLNISNAPVAGTNVTITTPYALRVAGGNSFFSGQINVAGGTATPAGGSANARLLLGSTSGFGIYYGSGAPTVSAGQGSLYMRSDGSSTSTRLYVNTDAGTTWTNVTTAA